METDIFDSMAEVHSTVVWLLQNVGPLSAADMASELKKRKIPIDKRMINQNIGKIMEGGQVGVYYIGVTPVYYLLGIHSKLGADRPDSNAPTYRETKLAGKTGGTGMPTSSQPLSSLSSVMYIDMTNPLPPQPLTADHLVYVANEETVRKYGQTPSSDYLAASRTIQLKPGLTFAQEVTWDLARFPGKHRFFILSAAGGLDYLLPLVTSVGSSLTINDGSGEVKTAEPAIVAPPPQPEPMTAATPTFPQSTTPSLPGFQASQGTGGFPIVTQSGIPPSNIFATPSYGQAGYVPPVTTFPGQTTGTSGSGFPPGVSSGGFPPGVSSGGFPPGVSSGGFPPGVSSGGFPPVTTPVPIYGQVASNTPSQFPSLEQLRSQFPQS